jgi:hypothetical protein
MGRTGPNERCPCGSGKKYKKCCQAKGIATSYTREDRANAWAKLERFIGNELGEEDDAAFEELWGRWIDRADDLDENMSNMSEHIGDLWFAFDRPLEDGRFAVDRFLDEHAPELSEGEKLYLRTLRVSSMRLYEIEEVRPGESLTLRDILEGDRITIQERLGSRTLHRFEWIAARVCALGASGKPELEGVLFISDFHHQSVRDGLRRARDTHLAENPGATVDSFYKTTPPSFHDVWAGAILEPYVPKLANTDGEEMVITQVLFDVLDRHALAEALDKTEGLSREEGEGLRWHWSGENAKGETVTLGLLEQREDALHLETNSLARGERGRALVEREAGAAVRHRATVHEDMQRRLQDELKKPKEKSRTQGGREEIPFEIQEALVLDHMARHYRKWLDEPVPALDGRVPREAAKDKAMRPRLIELLHGLDRGYQRSLAMGAPAFDPSWMWGELGLVDEEAASHPPPLAHERIAELIPGSGELCQSVAEAVRRRPDFKDAASVVTEQEAGGTLELQRFVRERGGAPRAPDGSLLPYLERLVNFHLHRRKSFWVDEALAYMLAQTDLDVVGRELRLPFPSFALVFTDRHVLSMAERLLARQEGCVLAGQYLRVATVFATELRAGDERTLQLCFALDALGADLPVLVTRAIPLRDDQPVAQHIDSIAPSPPIEPVVPNANPMRGLLQVTINAILYATSAGVEPELRPAPARAKGRPRIRGGPPITFSSDAIYFLPGAIEISHVRRLQELDRVPDGRTILRRFMVRGHWRRAAASWSDQRMRWIQPYWKGPDMAAIIERTYKLKA